MNTIDTTATVSPTAKPKAAKVFTILKNRKGVDSEITGTLEELTEHFGYTLECGHSYRSSIPLKPKTAKGLVSALQRSVDETQRGSYNPTFYELKTN